MLVTCCKCFHFWMCQINSCKTVFRLLSDCCKRYGSYFVDLDNYWLLLYYSHLAEDPQYPGLNLFNSLELYSGLSLLHRSGHLSRLDTNVVINALDVCPSAVLSGELFIVIISFISYIHWAYH